MQILVVVILLLILEGLKLELNFFSFWEYFVFYVCLYLVDLLLK